MTATFCHSDVTVSHHITSHHISSHLFTSHLFTSHLFTSHLHHIIIIIYIVGQARHCAKEVTQLSTDTIFPLFPEKLNLIAVQKDDQIGQIIRALNNYLKDRPINFTDDNAQAIYEMLISDYERYDKKCKADRERQRAYREKKAQAEAKETPKEEKPEKADSHSEEVKEIIDYLNTVMNAHYSVTAKAATKHIRARLDEGYSVGDFKIVIEKMHRLWKGTDMEKYLRPATLFNGEKFEGYLNRPDKTDAEMQQEQAFNKKYGVILDWGNDNDEQTGIHYTDAQTEFLLSDDA